MSPLAHSLPHPHVVPQPPFLAQLTSAGGQGRGGVFLAEGKAPGRRPQGSWTHRRHQGQGCVQCQGSQSGLEPERLKAAFVEKGLRPKKPGLEARRRRQGLGT